MCCTDPNDLGKSTLADAIRLALLLPHTSTHIEEYVPWTGGRDPLVEITFETGPQRIWRVRKEFRRGGAALLQESKNGVDFDDVERARKVDGRLRDILRWGIPEPGGAGSSKGLPTSFLATVLLSTQADVSAMSLRTACKVIRVTRAGNASLPRCRRWRRIHFFRPCLGPRKHDATKRTPTEVRKKPRREACSKPPPIG